MRTFVLLLLACMTLFGWSEWSSTDLNVSWRWQNSVAELCMIQLRNDQEGGSRYVYPTAQYVNNAGDNSSWELGAVPGYGLALATKGNVVDTSVASCRSITSISVRDRK